ncbi:unnamed protein product [Adineta steineri]|uniref:Wax synthase domain-containing protein n=1 Tax=Adineta steineri TaxID=433720 RepID=A0A815LR83_9BILA|nr:unnamed protein product [Adineta steineri]CAF3765438.1 unnamed protein product [Adineta steineri]
MLTFSKLVPIGWIAHLGACFYSVRPLRSLSYRALLTIVPCAALLFAGSQNLPHFHMSSVMTVSLYWMISIRLVDLIVFSPEKPLSLLSYIGKFLWFLFPIVKCNYNYPIIFDVISAGIKLLLAHWVYRWFLICEPSDSYAQMGMFYLFICTGTYVTDLQIALVRLITRDKYTILSFNDFPFKSRSIREFWGRRYNQLVSSLLKESVFEPTRRLFSFSSAVAALTSFAVSGLLHAHVAVACFGASSPLPAFTFFLLQGAACCAESFFSIKLPKPIGIVVTHMFLLVTAPLYVGLFTRAGSTYFPLNPPPLLNAKWLPQLPISSFSPK